MQIMSGQSKKRYIYGLYDFEIDPNWIAALDYTFANEKHYRSYQEFDAKPVQIVNITQINHKMRDAGTPIFNEKKELTAKERTVKILCGFDNGEKIKPVFLYREQGVDECTNLFKLCNGCHRVHCSIVYGFKCVPAVIYQEGELPPISK
jgi:hypothetical protein